ncbi:MAG TPA: hypothetical protein VNS81_09705 [Nocardioides sp.]|nr:hypothetical protein [Nocardioides sp.]
MSHLRTLSDNQRALREALKTVAVALKEGDSPFALAGSYGLWARGGPEPDHDVDFMVAEEDAPRAKDLLAERDLEVVQPPEDWLFKVYVGDAMVDVIFRARGVPIDRARFEDADEIEVESVAMPVLSATVLMTDKLCAMEEHSCNISATLPAARAVREQVEWDLVRRETKDNPFAEACLLVLERLDVIPSMGGH